MTDIRKWAFVGLMGLASMACSSSSGTATGGTTGSTGGTGTGTGGTHTGGTTGSTGGTSGGTGGAAGATVGCAMSDPPATADIATFSSADGGIAAMAGTYVYGDTPQPTFTIANGAMVMDTVQLSAKNHYQGFGIYMNGNAAGTDCTDASSYTGVQFDLSGSLTGTGCTMQFSINDSEHQDMTTAGTDTKPSGPAGSYAPQLQIAAMLSSTVTTVKVPFTGAGAPTGGSPASPIDPKKVNGVQWQMSTPVAADGGPTECVWNFTVANVKFYH
jgi:hypothetical protein